MCAIAGMCHSGKAGIDVPVLRKMIGTVRHRGPDGSGTYNDAGIGLANARLSIIDLVGGRQPLCNEDCTLWITFNGEIFNYVELRRELIARGHSFATHSDTEVILHLYEEKGEDCFLELNGQWGLALWDSRERKLLLSRDRLGVRPVFYTQVGQTLLFGSEIKSLFAHPGVRRELDAIGLDQIFTFWCTLPPRTVFKNIWELPPGHLLTFKSGKIQVRSIWKLSFESLSNVSAQASGSDGEQIEQLADLLTDAVRLRLRSDVPVGAYLSGGLDSTIITALINKISGERLRTFSIGFTPEHLDESKFQREAVKFLHTAHREIHCGYEDVASVFPDVVWHTERPIVRAAPAPLYLLSKQVRQDGFKVVLTGEGADEIFGGYDIYKEAKIRRFWASQPDSRYRAKLLRRLYPYQSNLQRIPDNYLRQFFRVGPKDLIDPLFSHLPRWELTSRVKSFFSNELNSELAGYDALADIASQLPESYGLWPPFCQSQYLETAFLLPGYILSSQGDRVGLAHAVEARHPFLDYRVVEFANRLPPHLKMRVLQEKYILKRAFESILPAAIVKRKKQPYRAPDGRSFFTGEKHDYVRDLLSPRRIAEDGIFDPSRVSSLVEKFRAGLAIGVKDDMALVGILSTQLVLDQFIREFKQGGSLCPEHNLSCAAS